MGDLEFLLINKNLQLIKLLFELNLIKEIINNYNIEITNNNRKSQINENKYTKISN